MKVKICGIRNMEAANCAVKNGADAVGFVFAKSKRRVSVETAKSIVSKLPKDILKVGVFVNPSLHEIENVVKKTGINLVQLHGNEPPEFCEKISLPIIKALSIETKEDLKKIHEYSCEYVLLDGPKGKYVGGNGIAFDWTYLSGFEFKGKKFILAGGLTQENIIDAIHETIPFMVDVSSGVETNGLKDLGKIKNFIERAKSTNVSY